MTGQPDQFTRQIPPVELEAVWLKQPRILDFWPFVFFIKKKSFIETSHMT
jgi:hypothetical protein